VIWTGGDDLPRGEAPLDELAAWHSLDARRWVGEFNWKLGVNAFLETYHFKIAHRTGIAPHFVGNRLLIDHLGEEHLRLALPRSVFAKPGEPRARVSFVYFLFPCSFVSILPDHASFISFLPDGLARTRVESHLYVPEGFQARREYWDRNAALFAQTIREDLELAASIQRGLDADASDTFRFGAFEYGLTHFHRALARLIAT
jgi:phenylpropionate dioxygenase-like ring-hydroxylating dioxygenase large terminal subunit